MAIEVKYKKDTVEITPANPKANLGFIFNPNKNRTDYEYDNEDQARAEAELADAMATVGEQNGISPNDLQNFLPAVLRMLKSNSPWAK